MNAQLQTAGQDAPPTGSGKMPRLPGGDRKLNYPTTLARGIASVIEITDRGSQLRKPMATSTF